MAWCRRCARLVVNYVAGSPFPQLPFLSVFFQAPTAAAGGVNGVTCPPHSPVRCALDQVTDLRSDKLFVMKRIILKPGKEHLALNEVGDAGPLPSWGSSLKLFP